jgi:hypothetical protein
MAGALVMANPSLGPGDDKTPNVGTAVSGVKHPDILAVE